MSGFFSFVLVRIGDENPLCRARENPALVLLVNHRTLPIVEDLMGM